MNVVAGVSLLAQLVLTVVGWVRIPSDARVAIHWGLNMQPNGWANKPFALLAIPVITIFVFGLFRLTRLSVEPAPGTWVSATEVGTLVVMALAQALIVFNALK